MNLLVVTNLQEANIALEYPITLRELMFLQESNMIENVYSSSALIDAAIAWTYLKSKKDLTEKDILKAHSALMRSYLPDNEAGHYRTVQVYVTGCKDLPPKAEEVPALMEEWMGREFDNEEQQHVAFEKIHPFVDGNGRIGRMLYNRQRIINKKPVNVIRASNRQEYYKWFE